VGGPLKKKKKKKNVVGHCLGGQVDFSLGPEAKIPKPAGVQRQPSRPVRLPSSILAL
jgi:hypothetical protein